MATIVPLSPQRIRDCAVVQMRLIFGLHLRIMILIMVLYLLLPSSCVVGLAVVSFVAFCNAFCLAERFWDVQRCTLIYWPPFCQGVFLVSRLTLVTAAVLFGVVWIRLLCDICTPLARPLVAKLWGGGGVATAPSLGASADVGRVGSDGLVRFMLE